MLQPVLQSGQTLFWFLEEPHALLVEKVLAAQGADRAEIDDVAGQLVVDRLAGEDVDLGMMAAVDHLQLGACRQISRVKRTQREHMMQRSVNSVMCSPMCGLFGGVFLSSIMRLVRLAEVDS